MTSSLLEAVVLNGLTAGGILILVQLSDAIAIPFRLWGWLQDRTRLPLGTRDGDLPGSQPEVIVLLPSWLGELLDCPLCLGSWLTLCVWLGLPWVSVRVGLVSFFAIYAVAVLVRAVAGKALEGAEPVVLPDLQSLPDDGTSDR